MMTKKEWTECRGAWERIKTQATIDLEQSEFFIDKINTHLNSFPTEEEEIKEA